MAGVRALAARLLADLVGTDDMSLVDARARRRADGEFDRRDRRHLVARFCRDIDRPGQTFEGVVALAEHAEIPAAGLYLRLAGDEHDADLVTAGLGPEPRACFELMNLEA